MHLIRQSLERRTFLKGMGASVALPFLDAMVPSDGQSAVDLIGRKVPVDGTLILFYHGSIC